MKPPPDYERFPMLEAAWNAAMSLVDDKGDLRGDLADAEARFLKRKPCQALVEDDCKAAFHRAVEIAQVATRFRRSSCGTLPPKPARRYELLLSLARELESKFPGADQVLVMAGCRMLEVCWDR